MRKFGASVMLLSLQLAPVVATSQPVGPGLRDFAAGLAAEGIPSGFVVPESSLVRRPGTRKTPTRPVRLQPVERAAAVAEQFNRDGRSFRAIAEAEVIHIWAEEIPSALVEALGRTGQVEEVVGLPAMRALVTVVMPLMRGGGEPGGVIGSGGISPGCPFNEPVTLKGGVTTATAVLDEIVRQTPGLAWIVTYDATMPTNNVKVGFICYDGSSTKMTMY